MKKLTCILVAAAVGVALAATSAQAQRRGGFGMMGGFGTDPLSLMLNEQVQKAIEAVPDQKAKLDEIRNELREEARKAFSGLLETPPEKRREAFQEARKKLDEVRKRLRKKAEGVLLKHQRDRVLGIYIQVAGDRALGDEAIIEVLALTAKQQKKLKEIAEGIQRKTVELFRGLGDIEDREKRREAFTQKREELRKAVEQARKEARGVLTARQTNKLEQMKGEEFKFDRRSLFRPRRPERPTEQTGGQ